MKERVAFSEGEKAFPGCLLQILPPEPEEGSCQSTYSRKKMLGSASSGSININRDGFGLNPGEVKIEFFLMLVISLKLLHI